MKRYFTVLLSACLSTPAALGQISKNVIAQFPPHVIYRIHEINKQVPLAENSQISLGRYFARQDSLAAATLQNTGKTDTLHTFYSIGKNSELQSLLQPLEYNSYCLKVSPRSSSLLRHIVEKQEVLHLSPSQTTALLKESDRMEALRDRSVKDWRIQELKVADDMLTHPRVMAYFKLEQEKKALSTARKWIAEMEKNFLIKKAEHTALLDSLYRFESEEQANLAYQKVWNDKTRNEKAKKQYEANKPLSLKRLDAYKRLPSWSVIRTVVQLNDSLQLGITPQETDRLLTGFKVFEEKRIELKKEKKKYSDRGLECQTLLPILTAARLEKIFRNKTAKEIQKKVNAHLEKLEKNGLLNNKDRSAVQKELTDYESKLAIAQEWVKMDRSQTNLFRLYDVKDHIPEVLKLLTQKGKEGNTQTKDNRF